MCGAIPCISSPEIASLAYVWSPVDRRIFRPPQLAITHRQLAAHGTVDSGQLTAVVEPSGRAFILDSGHDPGGYRELQAELRAALSGSVAAGGRREERSRTGERCVCACARVVHRVLLNSSEF